MAPSTRQASHPFSWEPPCLISSSDYKAAHRRREAGSGALGSWDLPAPRRSPTTSPRPVCGPRRWRAGPTFTDPSEGPPTWAQILLPAPSAVLRGTDTETA